jgi:hypothetical protein
MKRQSPIVLNKTGVLNEETGPLLKLQEAGLNKKYWAEAANTAIYVRSSCPSKAIGGEIPEELWSKKTVNLNHLRAFGCLAHAHVPKQERQKLDPKSIPKMFVRYCDTSKGKNQTRTHEHGN